MAGSKRTPARGLAAIPAPGAAGGPAPVDPDDVDAGAGGDPGGAELAGDTPARAELRDLTTAVLVLGRLAERRGGRRGRYRWLAGVVHELRMEAETLELALRGDAGARELRRTAPPRTLADVARLGS